MAGPAVTIHWKRLTTFVAVAAIAATGYVVANQNISADSVPFQMLAPGQAQVVIALDARGRTTVNGRRVASIVEPRTSSQRLEYIATDAQGQFIDLLTVTMTLPIPVTSDQVRLNAIGAYGIGSSTYELVSPTTIVYQVTQLSPQAIYTIQADLPIHYFALPITQELLPQFEQLPFTLWLAIGLALPLLALLAISLIARRTSADWRSSIKTNEQRDTPPELLAPAFAGVLVSGKMTPRMLAATMLDLAERGYLMIANHGTEFSFGKRRTSEGRDVFASELAAFEQALLDKLFRRHAIRSSQTDIDVRLGERLFSRKIAEIYLDVYDSLTEQSYFQDNPSGVWERYRSIGLGLFFLALVGFSLTLAFLAGPKFVLVSWVGLMVASLVVMRGAPYLPRRTAKGVQALRDWTAFRNWLVLPQPIQDEDAPMTYRRYLPYAVAFGVEVEWTRRFAGILFPPPGWLVTQADFLKIDDFATQLFPIIGYVATQFAAVRDPNS